MSTEPHNVDKVTLFYRRLYRIRNYNVKRYNEDLLSYLKLFLVIIVMLFVYSSISGITETRRGDYPIYHNIRVGAECNDGWISSSTGQGTCSWHGGVDEWIKKDVFLKNHIAEPNRFYAISLVCLLILIIPSFKYRGYLWIVICYSAFYIYWSYSLIKEVFILIRNSAIAVNTKPMAN